MLKIYNTLTQCKEVFRPLHPGKIGLYVCGMTVYDYCHIGHARVLAFFDLMVRLFKKQGFEVNYVRNITDIDDKIIQRAKENKETPSHLTARMIKAMQDDLAQLAILSPTQEPRATDNIAPMIELIQRLFAKGYAYLLDNGDVCFPVGKYKDYGELAHQDLEKLRRGSRVPVDNAKRDPLDFVLWKQAKAGEPSWPSPWGDGRPGWHIECSAMSMLALGEHFDIHGGGLDLVFPHHQNEIAQSQGATGKKFVNVWVHVGFVQVNHQKMSKSLGNFFTVRDVLAEYSAEVVRYFLIANHYRSPIHYSQENLQTAQAALQRLYMSLRGLVGESQEKTDSAGIPEEYRKDFEAALNDDFNTPDALAVLFELARDINRWRNKDPKKASQWAYGLREQASVLGLLQQDPDQFFKMGIKADNEQEVSALIDARNVARVAKDWPEADRIRHVLLELGVTVEDTEKGTNWRKLE